MSLELTVYQGKPNRVLAQIFEHSGLCKEGFVPTILSAQQLIKLKSNNGQAKVVNNIYDILLLDIY